MLSGADQQNGRRTNAPSRSSIVADEIPTKLRSLMERLESQSNSGHLTARNRKKLLAKMRSEISELARREARPFCNCKQITVAYGWSPEEFEAETKLVCAIHGRRRLGVIVPIFGFPYEAGDLRLMELMDTYYRISLELGG